MSTYTECETGTDGLPVERRPEETLVDEFNRSAVTLRCGGFLETANAFANIAFAVERGYITSRQAIVSAGCGDEVEYARLKTFAGWTPGLT